MLAIPGPKVPMHTAGLPVIRVMRRNNLPAPRFRFEEQVDEIRIWDAKDCVDALGLEQLKDALVNWNAGCHGGLIFRLIVVHF
jgi:hypothetical protein